MRPLCFAIVAGLMLAGGVVRGDERALSAPTIAELAARDEAAFHAELIKLTPALEKSKLSCADLLPVLRRLARESLRWSEGPIVGLPRPQPQIEGLELIPGASDPEPLAGRARSHWELFTMWWQAACRQAADDDVPALTELFATIEADETHTRAIFLYTASVWLRRELAAIVAESREAPAIVPDQLAQTPPELKANKVMPEILLAWRFARGALQPAHALARDVEPKVRLNGYENEDQRFGPMRHAALFAPTRQTVLDGWLLHWRSGCIVGDWERDSQRPVCALMACLRERRLREAVGAAVVVAGGVGDELDVAFPDLAAALECLHVLRVDWRRLFVGVMAGPMPSIERGFRSSDDSLQQFFIRSADTEGVRLLTALARSRTPERARYLLDSLGRFVEPGEFAAKTARPAYEAAPRVDADVQAEVLALLHESLVADLEGQPMEQTIRLVREIGRVESREPLRPLLDHWSTRVRKAAAQALAALGELPPELEERAPVRFALRLNGQPWTGTKVEAAVRCAEWSDRPEITVGRDGVLALGRDFFLRPARSPREVEFSVRSSDGQPRAVPGAGIIAPDSWVSTVALPTNLDELTVVNLQLGKLVVTVDGVRHPIPPEEDRMMIRLVRLRGLTADGKPIDRFESDGVGLPKASRVEFPALSRGIYEVAVSAPGMASWRSEPIRVGDGVALCHVKLRPGVSLGPPLMMVDDTQVFPAVEIWADGRRIFSTFEDGPVDMAGGFAQGRYQLRIWSSAKMNEEIRAADGEIGGWQENDSPSWETTEVQFTVGPQTPAYFQVGPIRLKPVAKSRR